MTDERWNQRAARLLRRECGLTGRQLDRAMNWWKRCREKGKGQGIGDDELEAAIVGLKQVYGRLHYPVEVYRVFCHKNHALFQEAMSAGFKVRNRQPSRMGTILKQMVKEG